MPTQQEDQTPIDLEIVEALVEASPGHWRQVQLDAERIEESDGESLRIQISSPEQHRDIVAPTDRLSAALRRLSLVFARHGRPFTRVRYIAEEQADGGWEFKAGYRYGDED